MITFWSIWLLCGILSHGFFHAYQMRDEPYPRCQNWRFYNRQDAYRLWLFSVVFNLVFGPVILIGVLGAGLYQHGWLVWPHDHLPKSE